MPLFEAVFSLCLAAAGPCRDVLLPGYEADTRAECEAALAQAPKMELASPARCVEAGPALAVEEAAPGVFLHRGAVAEPGTANGGDVSNLGFVVGERSVAVIDSSGAAWIGEALWRAIRARSDLPVSHLILTHMHPDHVFGAAVFAAAGAEVVGHAGLDRALADRQGNYTESYRRVIGAERFIGSHTVPVDVAVEDEEEIGLGNRRLRLRAWPRAHTGTDLTVLDEKSGILFAGDLVFSEHLPALDGSIRGWQAALTEMQKIPAVRVVPGHGGPLLPWPEGAGDTMRYLGVLADDIRAAIAEGARLGEAAGRAARSEAGKWQLFEAYNPRNATVAFTELEWE